MTPATIAASSTIQPMQARYIVLSRFWKPYTNHRHAETRYASHEASDTPPASRPIHTAMTCGTVISMVKTERPRSTFSRALAGNGDLLTQDASAGSMVMTWLLVIRVNTTAIGASAAKNLGVVAQVILDEGGDEVIAVVVG